MTALGRGRHRAPEPTTPAPSSSGGGFLAWMTLVGLVILVSALVGWLAHSGTAWGIVIVALVVGGMSAAINRVATTGAVTSPKVRREARYAGRTAERAGIFWVVYRVLNGIFR